MDNTFHNLFVGNVEELWVNCRGLKRPLDEVNLDQLASLLQSTISCFGVKMAELSFKTNSNQRLWRHIQRFPGKVGP